MKPIHILSLVVLDSLVALACSRPAAAQSVQYDLGAWNSGARYSTAATGNYANAAALPTGAGPRGTGGLRSRPAFTVSQNRVAEYAQLAMMAPDSVDMAPIPSGSFHYGFPKLGPAPYLGVTASQSNPYSMDGMLPQTATSAVDINVCDMPFIGGRGAGGAGGGPGGTGGPGGSPTIPTPPYQIGPDWAMVQNSHNGEIMGWMAPGETYVEFFSGQSGHLLPGEANRIEAEWILNNQLGGLGPSPWGP